MQTTKLQPQFFPLISWNNQIFTRVSIDVKLYGVTLTIMSISLNTTVDGWIRMFAKTTITDFSWNNKALTRVSVEMKSEWCDLRPYWPNPFHSSRQGHNLDYGTIEVGQVQVGSKHDMINSPGKVLLFDNNRGKYSSLGPSVFIRLWRVVCPLYTKDQGPGS